MKKIILELPDYLIQQLKDEPTPTILTDSELETIVSAIAKGTVTDGKSYYSFENLQHLRDNIDFCSVGGMVSMDDVNKCFCEIAARIEE